MTEIRICAVCGKSFEAHRETEVCCSKECKDERRREQIRSYRRDKAQEKKFEEQKKKKQVSRNKNSLTEIAIEARKAGMTYGQYVAKMGL